MEKEEEERTDCSGNPVITLQEALEEYEELEKASTAILGGSDPSNCSYSKGYLKRQAIYACMTCNPKAYPGFQPAGICLGCSYKCHEGHDLVELYTKRNFRCDCGNKKFSDNPCVLQAEKDNYNELNSYNQNFSGLYCTCHRPYPDPDESEESNDPMVQCVLCEDWHHTQHAIPGITWSDYENEDQELGVELICGSCTVKADFLCHYGSLQANASKIEVTTVPATVNGVNPENDKTSMVVVESKAVDVVDENAANTVLDGKATGGESDKGVDDSTSQDSGISSLNETEIHALSKTHQDDNVTTANIQDECSKSKLPKTDFKVGNGTIWAGDWRKKLCRCIGCKAMYENLKLGFLIEEDDTIESYETKGIANMNLEKLHAEESFNKQVDALGIVGQIELVAGYNDMKGALTEYLQQFATEERVVEKKDILEFFANYRAAKRPRLDSTFQY